MPPKSYSRAKHLLAERAALVDEPPARHVQDQITRVDRELVGLVAELVRLLEQHAGRLVAT